METNIDNVKKELMFEWDEERNDEGEYVPVKGKQLMEEREAAALIAKHDDIFQKGRRLGSFAYYTAQLIRKAEHEEKCEHN